MAGPEQHEILAIEKVVFPLLLETFLYALYVVLIIYLVFRPWLARGTTSLPIVIVLSTLSMFAIYSLYWALEVYLLWAKFYYLLEPEPTSAPDIRIKQSSWKGAPTTSGLPPEAYPLIYVQWVAGLALIVLGDFVSIWRAWAIFGKPRWLYILFVGAAVLESVTFLLLFITTSPAYFPTSSAFANVGDKARLPLTFLGYSVTGAAQVGATSLIAYKAWRHWKDVRATAKSRNVATLVTVVESGIIYLALLASYGFTNLFDPKTGSWTTITGYYSVPLTAMYPTLIVALVASRRTVLEEASVASMDGIQFAAGGANRVETIHYPSFMARPTFTLPRGRLDDSEFDIECRIESARNSVSSSDGDDATRTGHKETTLPTPP